MSQGGETEVSSLLKNGIVTVTHRLKGVEGDVCYQKHALHSGGWLKDAQDTHIHKHIHATALIHSWFDHEERTRGFRVSVLSLNY